MGRIPEEEIERIKRDVPVAELVRARGVELGGHGENLIGRCPFHDDRTPSLVVTPAKNLWHCLGACQRGGSVIDWVMKSEGVSFRHAAEILRNKISPLAASTGPPPKKTSVPKLASPVSVDMDEREMLLRIVDYYHDALKSSPEALRYLSARAIGSVEAIDHFKLGFANRTLGLRLPSKNRKEGAELRERLARLGIFRAESGHEHFNGSIVVPIFDEEGSVAEMYGRKVGPGLKLPTPPHLYLPGGHRGVWNLDALRTSKEIILCEALIDALTFWCAGYHNVTASYGVEGFTRDHLEAFKAYGTERVLIAYDRDEAGDRAAARLAEKLMSEGIDCYRVEFPRGMDANEYARKVRPAAHSLGVLLRSAAWIGNGSAEARSARLLAMPATVPSSIAAPVAPTSEEPAPSLVASSPAGDEVNVLTFPTPSSPRAEIAGELPYEVRGEEIVVTLGDRVYRIRGMKKNTSFDSLKINILLERPPTGAVYLDTFDLAMARQRAMFEKQAAMEIGVKEEVLHREMGRILRALEDVRAKQIEEALAPKVQPVVMNEGARAAALNLLNDGELLQRITRDLTRCGLVGENTNKLVAYLAATSRKLDRPLAVIIQSSSAAGKTALMDAVLGCMPDEEVVRYSAITGKALFYIPEPTSLKHKILAISEEQGAEQATYALKLLQSEGRLSIASTGKDPTTGRLESQEYHVEGPIMPIMTTTAPEVDEELQNRCIVLTADEDRAQTRAIHESQRAAHTIEGLVAVRAADDVRKVHQNAQRLLKPLLVAIPQAKELTFLDARTRTRRDHMKYLTLIRTIALLHQYQRERKTHDAGGGTTVDYIEASVEDIALANELAHEVLGRSLDELAPQTRKLLTLLVGLVDRACGRMKIEPADYRFTQREVRESTGWPDYQVKLHMRKLVEMEYVLVHRGGRGQSFVYELVYRGEGTSGKPFLMGLIDVEKLRVTEKWDSSPGDRDSANDERDTSGTAQGHARNSRGTTGAIPGKASAEAASSQSNDEKAEKLLLPKPEKKPKVRSYLMRRTPLRRHPQERE